MLNINNITQKQINELIKKRQKLEKKENAEKVYNFYKKYLWKEIDNHEIPSGLILRTIFCQFGKWCVEKGYIFANNNDTKRIWFEKIIPYLCNKEPCVKVLRGHTNDVSSVVKLNENTIVSASFDETLRVWDLTNYTSRVLRGHTESVCSVIKLNETTIVSASVDTTLRIWDLTNDTSQVLTGHEDDVKSLIKFNDTTIISGSADETLRVWDLTNYTSRVLTGHEHEVNSLMKLNETEIISASYDGTLRLWNLTDDTSSEIDIDINYRIGPCSNEGFFINTVIKLTENPITIITGSSDDIRLFNKYELEYMLEEHTGQVLSLLKLNETTFVSGGSDNRLLVWDLNGYDVEDAYRHDISHGLKGNKSLELKGHIDDINSVIKLNETKIVSGSSDSTLRIWDLRQ